MASRQRVCGRAGCSLQGGWTEQFEGFLNRMTTQTAAHSLINLVMQDSSVMFRTLSGSQQKLGLDLAPALRRVGARG
jgi:hypothetical protein